MSSILSTQHAKEKGYEIRIIAVLYCDDVVVVVAEPLIWGKFPMKSMLAAKNWYTEYPLVVVNWILKELIGEEW